jgi:hypothetical protein
MFRPLLSALLVSVLALGCKSLSAKHSPVHHSPLAWSPWKTAGWPPNDKDSKSKGPSAPTARDDIREQMAARATALLEKGEERPGFGAEDVDKALAASKVDLSWRAGDGLKALVDLARKRSAYHTDGAPERGDIVLFHNQRDLNANNENDDWLTGAGIVVDRSGRTFDAVIRTGHAPRRITACPSKPSYRTENGEVINSFVRIPTKADPRDTAYLAGQLYAGHVDIEVLCRR